MVVRVRFGSGKVRGCNVIPRRIRETATPSRSIAPTRRKHSPRTRGPGLMSGATTPCSGSSPFASGRRSGQRRRAESSQAGKKSPSIIQYDLVDRKCPVPRSNGVRSSQVSDPPMRGMGRPGSGAAANDFITFYAKRTNGPTESPPKRNRTKARWERGRWGRILGSLEPADRELPHSRRSRHPGCVLTGGRWVAGVERSEPPEIEALGARCAGPQPPKAEFFNGLLIWP